MPPRALYKNEPIGSVSNSVFERRMSTGSGVFALFGHDFGQILGQIHTNLVASRHLKRDNRLTSG